MQRVLYNAPIQEQPESSGFSSPWRLDSEPLLDSEPILDSEPLLDSKPIVDSKTLLDSETILDSKPLLDSETLLDLTRKPERSPDSPDTREGTFTRQQTDTTQCNLYYTMPRYKSSLRVPGFRVHAGFFFFSAAFAAFTAIAAASLPLPQSALLVPPVQVLGSTGFRGAPWAVLWFPGIRLRAAPPRALRFPVHILLGPSRFPDLSTHLPCSWEQG